MHYTTEVDLGMLMSEAAITTDSFERVIVLESRPSRRNSRLRGISQRIKPRVNVVVA